MGKYTRLKIKDRVIIEFLKNKNEKLVDIAVKLNRNKSTICREIKRLKDSYSFLSAQNDMEVNKLSRYKFKSEKYKEFTELFLKYYDKKYCGVETTLYLIKTKHKNVVSPCVSQTYNWINSYQWVIKPPDKLRSDYIKGNKRQESLFAKVKNKYVLPIWLRPKEINDRSEFGHWELDTVVGGREVKEKGIVMTLVERKTRKSIIIKMRSKHPLKAISLLKKKIEADNIYVKTITADNGMEFMYLGILAKWLKIKVYFCDSYTSWQKGTNENFNGLFRREYPKGTNLKDISIEDLLKLQNKINNMPRKILGWKASNSVYNKCVQQLR